MQASNLTSLPTVGVFCSSHFRVDDDKVYAAPMDKIAHNIVAEVNCSKARFRASYERQGRQRSNCLRGNSPESLYCSVSILCPSYGLVKGGLTSRDHGFASPGTGIELQAVHARLVRDVQCHARGKAQLTRCISGAHQSP